MESSIPPVQSLNPRKNPEYQKLKVALANAKYERGNAEMQLAETESKLSETQKRIAAQAEEIRVLKKQLGIEE